MSALCSDREEAAHVWAESYPFRQPLSDLFVFSDGVEKPVRSIPRSGHAVLASGSNASPEQLRRKFGVRTKPVFVEAVTVTNHTVVYSAHFTGYGSVPATLVACEGTQTRAYVTWLDDADLELMHQTEAIGVNYDYAADDPILATDGQGKTLAADGFYRTRCGLLSLKGAPVRLAEIPSLGSAWAKLTQRALLKVLAAQHGMGENPRRFVSRLIRDKAFRIAATAGLGRLENTKAYP